MSLSKPQTRTLYVTVIEYRGQEGGRKKVGRSRSLTIYGLDVDTAIERIRKAFEE